MPRPVPPLLSLALTVLRLSQGWTQEELGAAVGKSGKMISRYERGDPPPSWPLLESMAAAMGLGPEEVGLTVLVLQQILTQPEAPVSSLGPTEAESRLIARATALKALEEADARRLELTRSLRQLRARHAREEAQALWEYLKGKSVRDRLVLVEGGREYKTWALCERLCFASESAAADDAGEAVELAKLAVRAAELNPPEDEPEAFRLRLQGFAWAFLANSLRVQGNHPKADEAFARSDELWSAGASGADPELFDEARLPDLKASLRRHQGRFDEALKLHAEALTRAKPEDRGYILLSTAKTLEEMEHYQESIATLKQAEAVVDAQREPRHLCVLKFNLAANLCHLERYSEAEALLPEVRGLAARLSRGLDTVRLRWLEGKVAAGLRRYDEALAAFSQVRAELKARGIAFDTALVTLELARVHLELGHTGEVKTLARQMVPIFEAQGGNREALAALLLFREAAEKEAVTVEFIRRMILYLPRARRNPDLRFEA